MQYLPAKIGLILLLLLMLTGCNAVKRVPEGKHLLTKTTITVNNEENRLSEIAKIPYQKPNTRLLGLPLRLYIYNWARPNIDSILQTRLIENERRREFWTAILSRKQLDKYISSRIAFNNTLKNTGEPPTVISRNLTQRSAERLEEYYHSNGWFNATANFEIRLDSVAKRGETFYKVNTGKAYKIDSLKTFIKSTAADSIYKKHRNESLIIPGNQYKLLDVNEETSRITELMRNNGLFYFDRSLISFIGDSVKTGNKVNIELYIKNRQLKNMDSIYEVPLQVRKISRVNVFTDYEYALRNTTPADTITVNNYNLFAFGKINYKPKHLTDAIFIEPGDIYSDKSRNKSLIRLSQLRTFRYPDLRFTQDPEDPSGKDLIANFYLTPLPKFTLRADFDVSTSNIQRFGIAGGGSLLIRNVFGGLETLQLSGRGSIGASQTPSNDASQFFDITEIGTDVSLSIPRIFFPISTRRFIDPEMSPSTNFTTGIGIQKNIGLDKQNITGGINYRWYPSQNLNYRFDLFDIQYIRNLNPNNYFNVYSNSYDQLNQVAINNLASTSPFLRRDGEQLRLRVPDGARAFITAVQNKTIPVTARELDLVSDIEERRQRLTEDNLIQASSFTFVKNTRENLFDEDFTSFRAKLEVAGNVLYAISRLADLKTNPDGSSRVLGVTFSQYVKTELNFIKHWDFGDGNILALRAFGGVAIPYGNSNSIPFIRSFFGGGSNDNRAWQAYRLGPGSTNSPNEFNEANLKLAFNLEQRFELVGDLKGAIFTDIGNIWNVLDNVNDPAARFESLESLEDIALGSGFGLRYDFSFFVLRFDVGFKTYNPAYTEGERWFKEYNFSNAVYNVGINYPF